MTKLNLTPPNKDQVLEPQAKGPERTYLFDGKRNPSEPQADSQGLLIGAIIATLVFGLGYGSAMKLATNLENTVGWVAVFLLDVVPVLIVLVLWATYIATRIHSRR